MYGKFQQHLQAELASIEEAGLYKRERNIASAQSAEITLEDGSKALNFCANNYLGLADSPRLIEAAKKAMDERGFGMSSVRFICGTQDLHKQLEAAVSKFFKTEDTILYASCFDANGGVFEPLLTADDAIISDSLNHASIIDGVRLCKAVRYRYANADMADLERQLQLAQAQRFRIICTDGVFSMDGNVAPMDQICDLAEKYDALVMWPRRGGAVQLLWPARYFHGHARKGFRWHRGRFHHRPEGNYRHAAPAFPSVPFLQFAAADDRGRGYRDVQDARGERCPA